MNKIKLNFIQGKVLPKFYPKQKRTKQKGSGFIGNKKLLNPKNDYVFKRIFGYEGNEDITEDFLSKILKEKVTNVKLDKNKILEKDIWNDKLGILDVRATIDDKVNVAIEIQIANENNIEKRILYYWSKLYSKELKQGKNYNKLKRTVLILISNFNLKT